MFTASSRNGSSRNWKRVVCRGIRLRNDRKLIIHAAAQAQHACDYVLHGNINE
jgi:hypothetical protein